MSWGAEADVILNAGPGGLYEECKEMKNPIIIEVFTQEYPKT